MAMPALAITLASLAVGGTVYSMSQQAKAAKKQAKAAEVETARSRREQVRQARMRRAATLNLASGLGVAGSSGAISGADNVTTSLGANLTHLDTMSELQAGIARNMNRANIGQGVAGLASQGFSAIDGGQVISDFLK